MSISLKYLSLILVSILLVSCGSSKNQNTEEEVGKLIKQQEFNIESSWATPLGGNRINLIGNPNFVKFKQDSVTLFLPYFGVRQMGGGYGSENSIKYEGPLNELEIDKQEQKKRYRIKFEGAHQNESFDFNIFIYNNGKTDISVNSTQRNTISYQGEIDALEEKE